MGRTVGARQSRSTRQECVMLIHILYSEPASVIAAVFCSLIVAGLLKGIIGVGMPIVALPLLSLFIDVKSAVMLLSMPLIFNNVPQALEGGKTGQCLMQLMPVILGMIPGLFLGVRVLLALDATLRRLSQAWWLWLSAASRCSRRSCSFRLAWFYQPASHSDFSAGFGSHRSDAGTACFHISACKGTARKGFHKGSVAVSRRFRGFAGNSSDRQPPVQLA